MSLTRCSPRRSRAAARRPGASMPGRRRPVTKRSGKSRLGPKRQAAHVRLRNAPSERRGPLRPRPRSWPRAPVGCRSPYRRCLCHARGQDHLRPNLASQRALNLGKTHLLNGGESPPPEVLHFFGLHNLETAADRQNEPLSVVLTSSGQPGIIFRRTHGRHIAISDAHRQHPKQPPRSIGSRAMSLLRTSQNVSCGGS